jgi:hypothetical protein
MIAFGDEASYGKILEYCERVDDSDQNSPDGFQMEHHLRESIPFGDGLAILETQKNLVRGPRRQFNPWNQCICPR